MKYFEDEEEYPGDILMDILPWGTLWSYISSTFLNGFINYCKPIKSILLNRYLEWEEDPEIEISVASPLGSTNWVKKTPKTKRELFKELSKDGAVYHSNIGDFMDDVLILAKINSRQFDTSREYIFFWYDRDCSDCNIGRFKTDDSEKEVIKEFDKFCSSLEYEVTAEIPNHFYQGWIKG